MTFQPNDATDPLGICWHGWPTSIMAGVTMNQGIRRRPEPPTLVAIC